MKERDLGDSKEKTDLRTLKAVSMRCLKRPGFSGYGRATTLSDSGVLGKA